MEYVYYFFTPAEKKAFSQNLVLATVRLQEEGTWVVAEIMQQTRTKDQVAMYIKFVEIAEHCLELRNYFSLFNIVGALGSSDVRHHKRLMKMLPEKVKRRFDSLELLMDPSRNMKRYRDLLAAEPDQPYVPFLPLHLKDLVFMNEVKSTRGDQLINYEKLRLIGKFIANLVMRRFYDLKRNTALQAYLKISVLPDFSGAARLRSATVTKTSKGKAGGAFMGTMRKAARALRDGLSNSDSANLSMRSDTDNLLAKSPAVSKSVGHEVKSTVSVVAMPTESDVSLEHKKRAIMFASLVAGSEQAAAEWRQASFLQTSSSSNASRMEMSASVTAMPLDAPMNDRLSARVVVEQCHNGMAGSLTHGNSKAAVKEGEAQHPPCPEATVAETVAAEKVTEKGTRVLTRSHSDQLGAFWPVTQGDTVSPRCNSSLFYGRFVDSPRSLIGSDFVDAVDRAQLLACSSAVPACIMVTAPSRSHDLQDLSACPSSEDSLLVLGASSPKICDTSPIGLSNPPSPCSPNLPETALTATQTLVYAKTPHAAVCRRPSFFAACLEDAIGATSPVQSSSPAQAIIATTTTTNVSNVSTSAPLPGLQDATAATLLPAPHRKHLLHPRYCHRRTASIDLDTINTCKQGNITANLSPMRCDISTARSAANDPQKCRSQQVPDKDNQAKHLSVEASWPMPVEALLSTGGAEPLASVSLTLPCRPSNLSSLSTAPSSFSTKQPSVDRCMVAVPLSPSKANLLLKESLI